MPKHNDELPETLQLAITKVIPLIFFKPFPLMGRVVPLVTFSDEEASKSKKDFLELEQQYKAYLNESDPSQREVYQAQIKKLCHQFAIDLSSPECKQERFQKLKLALTNYSRLALMGGAASCLMLAAGIATILLFTSGVTPLFIVAGLSALLIGSLGLLVYGIRALMISKMISSLPKDFDISAFSSGLTVALDEDVRKPVSRERIIDHEKTLPPRGGEVTEIIDQEETLYSFSAPPSPRVDKATNSVDTTQAKHSSSVPSSPRDGKGRV